MVSHVSFISLLLVFVLCRISIPMAFPLLAVKCQRSCFQVCLLPSIIFLLLLHLKFDGKNTGTMPSSLILILLYCIFSVSYVALQRSFSRHAVIDFNVFTYSSSISFVVLCFQYTFRSVFFRLSL